MYHLLYACILTLCNDSRFQQSQRPLCLVLAPALTSYASLPLSSASEVLNTQTMKQQLDEFVRSLAEAIYEGDGRQRVMVVNVLDKTDGRYNEIMANGYGTDLSDDGDAHGHDGNTARTNRDEASRLSLIDTFDRNVKSHFEKNIGKSPDTGRGSTAGERKKTHYQNSHGLVVVTGVDRLSSEFAARSLWMHCDDEHAPHKEVYMNVSKYLLIFMPVCTWICMNVLTCIDRVHACF